MTEQEIVKAVIDGLGVIVSWPVVILILVFMFRKRVEEAIGVLTERLRSVSIGGASAKFNSAIEELPPLLQDSARLNTTGDHADELSDMQDGDMLREVDARDSSVDEAEMSDFDRRIEDLGK